jgi:hypothetical protein
MRALWIAGGVMAVAVCALAAKTRADDAQTAAQVFRLVQGEDHSRSDRQKSVPEKTGPELNTLRDLFSAIHRCYKPPPLNEAKPGMRMTVQFSYTRDGELFGKPRILYESPGATPVQQSAYRSAVAAALVRCTPLPFSKSLGNAVAGRVMSIQFIDERNLRGAERVVPRVITNNSTGAKNGHG